MSVSQGHSVDHQFDPGDDGMDTTAFADPLSCNESHYESERSSFN